MHVPENRIFFFLISTICKRNKGTLVYTRKGKSISFQAKKVQNFFPQVTPPPPATSLFHNDPTSVLLGWRFYQIAITQMSDNNDTFTSRSVDFPSPVYVSLVYSFSFIMPSYICVDIENYSQEYGT